MSGYNDIHKKLVQGIISKPIMMEEEMINFFSIVSGRQGNKNILETMINQINKEIKRFHIEIKEQICDISSSTFFVLVSIFTDSTEALDKAVHSFSQVEREFFRTLLEEIINADDRCITRNTAINLKVAGGSQSQRATGPMVYTSYVERFLLEGWLTSLADDGKLFLGPRAIAELEHELLTVYNIEQCYLCHRVCVVGYICDSRGQECGIVVHSHCLQIYTRKKACDTACPNCNDIMRHM